MGWPTARMDHFVATEIESQYITHVQFLFSARSLTLRIVIFIVILSGVRNACISTVECFVRVLVAQKLQLVFKYIVILNTCRFSSSPPSVVLHSCQAPRIVPLFSLFVTTDSSPQNFVRFLKNIVLCLRSRRNYSKNY